MAIVSEPELTGDDVGCHSGNRTTLREGMCADPEQGVAHRNLQLHGHHSGRLVDLRSVGNSIIQTGSEHAGLGRVLHRQYGLGHRLCDRQASLCWASKRSPSTFWYIVVTPSLVPRAING